MSTTGRLLREERGITLTELVIYSLLLVIVGALVGGLIVRGFTSQRDIASASEATNSGQNAAQYIADGIRNASAIGLVASSAGTELLVARTAGSGATLSWTCTAWYYDGDAIRTISSTAGAPTETQAADGLLLASGVRKLDSTTPVFGLPATFSLATRSIELRFEVENPEGLPVLFETTAVSRQPQPPDSSGSTPCL